MIDWEAIAALKATPEYLELGVLGRERLLYATFPALKARHDALTARHLERSVWGRAVTPYPDE